MTAVSIALAACGARTELLSFEPRDESGTGGATSSSTTSSSSASSGSQGGGGEAPDAGPDAPLPVEDVYVHGGSTLYKLDLENHHLVTVGNFSGCDSGVLDIALSRDGRLFGTTFDRLVQIDLATAACSTVGNGSYPNSLGFVPDLAAPSQERLVGYVGAAYTLIDTEGGLAKTIGFLDAGDLASSGDLMILPDGRVYLSVVGTGCNDCLVEIDPETGAMVKNVGKLDYSAVYGLASSEGLGYGFTSEGQAFTIDLEDAATLPFAIPDAPQGVSFFGAASKPPP